MRGCAMKARTDLNIMKRKVTGDISVLQSRARANTSKRRDNFLTDPENVAL